MRQILHRMQHIFALHMTEHSIPSIIRLNSADGSQIDRAFVCNGWRQVAVHEQCARLDRVPVALPIWRYTSLYENHR